MSEPQEFGGPINRPAHNARQVSPGEAQEGFRPTGGGLDFLGLNEQVQPASPQQAAPAPQPQAPQQPESWLMQMSEPASVDLAPPEEIRPYAPASTPSATATSLLNASWREEPAPARRSRWIAPIAGCAALAVLGMIGLPMLRKPEPSPSAPAATTARAPATKSSSEPAAAFPTVAPVEVDDGASSDLATELAPLEPVAPDPMLDRARPSKGSRRGAVALDTGRSEAPVNAPPPGASFVPPPVEVFDPAGVWQVQSGDGDVDTGSEASFDAQAADDGAAAGPSASARSTTDAPGTDSLLAAQIQADDCGPGVERQAALPGAVEVDWDRLIWIARAETERAEATRPATEDEAKARGERKRGRKNAAPQDEGISRAMAAWSGVGEPETPASVAAPNERESEVSSTPTTEVARSDSASEETANSTEPSFESSSTSSVASVAAEPVAETVREPARELVAEAVAQPPGEVTAEVATEFTAEVVAETVAAPAIPVAPPAAEPVATSVARVVASEPLEPASSVPTPVDEPTPSPADESALAVAESSLSTLDPLAPPTSSELDALAAPKVKVLGRASRRALRDDGARRRDRVESAEREFAMSAPEEPSSALAVQAPSAATATPPASAAAPASIPTPESASTEAPTHVAAVPTVTPDAGPAAPASAPSASSAPPQSASTDTPETVELARAPVATSAASSERKGATAPAETAPTRALKVASEADLERVRGGKDVPLDALNAKPRVATPDVGKARVVFHTGEIFEGDLVAVGEGCLWLRGKHGTLGLDGARVKSAMRLAPGDAPVLGAPGSQRLAGLPRARVTTPGGPLYGKIVERDEHRTTLITDSGARVVLDSRSVEVLSEEPRVQIRP